MKRTFIIVSALGLLLMGILTGCYPDKIDYLEEYDLAATRYDDSVDFAAAYNTFSVADTIMHLTEDGEDDANLSRVHDAFILAEIRANMNALGYTEIIDPDTLNKPDLLILVEAHSSDYYAYYSNWYSYWGYYPGWGMWYPGWGGGWYPGYPWYPYYPAYSYSTGTLILDMMDLTAADPVTETLPDIVWNGFIDGVLVNDASSTRARLDKQINQLFEQSPYLQQ